LAVSRSLWRIKWHIVFSVPLEVFLSKLMIEGFELGYTISISLSRNSDGIP
jgi:hypothetical protein